jgi:hypothetical protein
LTATFIARLSIGHQRTARTGDARLSVRQSALCRMGFGQTHGVHGIFLTKEKYQCRCRPSPLAPSAPHRANFFQGACAPCVLRRAMCPMGWWRTVGCAMPCGWRAAVRGPASVRANFAASTTHVARSGPTAAP